MHITINGEERIFDGVNTVEKLLQELQMNLKGCAVELNGEVVPRGEHASTLVKDGDKLEIIQMVGGG